MDKPPALARVRAAVPDDVASICRVCSTAYRETYLDLLPAEYIDRTIQEFYNEERVRREIAADPPGWFGYQVVEESGQVLGAAGGGMTSPGTGELFVIYLDPGRRGEGFGTLLLDRVIAQLRGAGAREIWVSVAEGNEKGIPFYRARGFETMGRRRTFQSRPEDNAWSLRMRRSLPATA